MDQQSKELLKQLLAVAAVLRANAALQAQRCTEILHELERILEQDEVQDGPTE